jgi:hypothetical protein
LVISLYELLGNVWSNPGQKKKAREIIYKAHWTELLVSAWTNYYTELIIINKNF